MVTLLSKDYEPGNLVRMDWLPKGLIAAAPNVNERPIYKALEGAIGEESKTMNLGPAKQIIQDQGLGSWKNDKEFNALLRENGWSFTYTFEGV